MIGKLERVPLREVWKSEATDFTRWLRENIDVLNEVLDLNLVNPEREQEAGDFAVDLVAGDGSDNSAIIRSRRGMVSALPDPRYPPPAERARCGSAGPVGASQGTHE